MSAKRITRGADHKTRDKVEEMEIQFLAHYHLADSDTKGQKLESALKAGFGEKRAVEMAERILEKYGDLSFKTSLNAFGVTKPFLAMKIRRILDMNPEESAKDILAAARLGLIGLGESTDQPQQNVFNAPVMMIQGLTASKLNALRKALPQPTPAQLERESEQRAEYRLSLMKQKKYLPRVDGRKVRMCERWNIGRGKPCTCGMHLKPETPDDPAIPDFNQHDDCPPPEAGTEAR